MQLAGGRRRRGGGAHRRRWRAQNSSTSSSVDMSSSCSRSTPCSSDPQQRSAEARGASRGLQGPPKPHGGLPAACCRISRLPGCRGGPQGRTCGPPASAPCPNSRLAPPAPALRPLDTHAELVLAESTLLLAGVSHDCRLVCCAGHRQGELLPASRGQCKTRQGCGLGAWAPPAAPTCCLTPACRWRPAPSAHLDRLKEAGAGAAPGVWPAAATFQSQCANMARRLLRPQSLYHVVRGSKTHAWT